MAGNLFIVATPIGNWDDITFRALKILKEADIIVYEEHREGNRLLSHYGIQDKETEILNEHNEKEMSGQIIAHLKANKTVALISDAGTPVFSDPGHELVRMAIAQNISIIPVPGATSLVPAIVASGFPTDEFLFYGFLSQKSDLRIRELKELVNEERTIIFLDAPYRLVGLMKDIKGAFGDDRLMAIAFNLTMPDEAFFRGTAGELYGRFEDKKIKGEFVVVVKGAGR